MRSIRNIIVLIALGIASTPFAKEREKIDVGIPGTERAVQWTSKATVPMSQCYEYENYVVVEKSSGDVGSDIWVTRKKPGLDVRKTCDGQMADIVIKNRESDSFFGLWGRVLFVDSGTGPSPRGLSIYDLDSRKFVLNTDYLGAGDRIRLEKGALVVWEYVERGTEKNCKDWARYHLHGMDSSVFNKVEIDVTSLVRKKSGETKCLQIQ